MQQWTGAWQQVYLLCYKIWLLRSLIMVKIELFLNAHLVAILGFRHHLGGAHHTDVADVPIACNRMITCFWCGRTKVLREVKYTIKYTQYTKQNKEYTQAEDNVEKEESKVRVEENLVGKVSLISRHWHWFQNIVIDLKAHIVISTSEWKHTVTLKT